MRSARFGLQPSWLPIWTLKPGRARPFRAIGGRRGRRKSTNLKGLHQDDGGRTVTLFEVVLGIALGVQVC